jgi:hypothetical protein
MSENDMSENDLSEFDPYIDKTISVSRRSFNNSSNQNAQQSETETPDDILGAEGELILVVRGMVERIMIRQHNEVKLGRFEPPGPNELDLTPYGAADRGVSRFHARIHVENNQLFITDMNSTNGTYVSGVKIAANTATLLHKGDELVIGRLPVQVMFR